MSIALEYRTNNAFDTILLVRDGRDVLSEWPVGPSQMRDLLDCAQHPDDWDDQGGTELSREDYGALLAVRTRHTLLPIDDDGWDARVRYMMRDVTQHAASAR